MEDSTPVGEWAEEVNRRVYREWKSNYSDWEGGVKTFYSPVKENPPLLILGDQPGGQGAEKFEPHRNRFESGDFSPPEENEFIEKDYRLARRMEDLFEGMEPLLERSVVSNLNFFRAKDESTWRSRDSERRRAAEAFCAEIISETVQRLQPDRILLYGIGTFRRFHKRVVDTKPDDATLLEDRNDRRLFCMHQVDGRQILGITHPSPPYTSTEDWERLKDSLRKELTG